MSTLAAALPGLVPEARHQIVRVVEQEQLARDTYRLRLATPEIAAEAVPGQFFMIRQPGTMTPLLARPFALYDTWLNADGEPAGIDVVYLVVGKMTGVMSDWQAGDDVELWGPLGNGFPVAQPGRLLLVAGGIGNTPFLATAREALGGRSYGTSSSRRQVAAKSPKDVTVCYGVRSKAYLAGVAEFEALGINLKIATDDGSFGHHGFVTALVAEQLATNRPAAIYCCGPEPMMHAVSKLAHQHGVDCWLSLETPMACGFGACFSCVTRVRQPDGGWDYRRVCVEGPIFPARDLALD